MFHFNWEPSALSAFIIQREAEYVFEYMKFFALDRNNFVVFTNSIGDLILKQAMWYDEFPVSKIKLLINYSSPKSSHPFVFIDPKIANFYKKNENYDKI